MCSITRTQSMNRWKRGSEKAKEWRNLMKAKEDAPQPWNEGENTQNLIFIVFNCANTKCSARCIYLGAMKAVRNRTRSNSIVHATKNAIVYNYVFCLFVRFIHLFDHISPHFAPCAPSFSTILCKQAVLSAYKGHNRKHLTN